MDRVLKRGGCSWLPSEASVVDVLRQLLEQVGSQSGRASFEAGQGVPGVLLLGPDTLEWELSPFLRNLVKTILGLVPANVPQEVVTILDGARWALPLSEIVEVRVEGALFRQSLQIVRSDRLEIFRLRGARGWKRAVEMAAGIVPETGLSRAPRHSARDESLSRDDAAGR